MKQKIKAPLTHRPTLLSVPQFSEQNPAFSQGGVRYLIFNAEKNGLQKSGALVRLGRRILIDEEKFFSWVENQQNLK